MATLTKEDFRKRIDVLIRQFSDSFASYQVLQQRHVLQEQQYRPVPPDEEDHFSVGNIFLLGVLVLLIAAILFSDHFFALELVESIMYEESHSMINMVAWAMAVILVAFSIIFVIYNQSVEADAEIVPGVVSSFKIWCSRICKFAVPFGFYAVVAYTKITMLQNLAGADASFIANQLVGLMGMAIVGVLSHTCLIIIGPRLFPVVIPTLTSWLVGRKQKSHKNLSLSLKRKQQEVDTHLRNLMIAFQRAADAFPNDKEYFRMSLGTLNTEERAYAQQMYQQP